MHLLENNRPGSRTSAAEALKRAFPLIKRKGTLIVISDFFDDPGAIFRALSPYLHRGFRVHLFHVLAPEEIELEDRGLTTFVDSESGDRIVAHTGAIRTSYREAIQAHIRNLRELAVRKQVDYAPARTDTHFFNLFDRLVTR